MERAAPIICTVVVPVAGHEAFVPPSSAVEVWAGNGARGTRDAVFARAIRLRGGTHVGVVCLFWMMRWDDPTVVAPSVPEGFGSKLVHRTVAAQLGGAIAFDWSPEGVVVTLRMNKGRLAL